MRQSLLVAGFLLALLSGCVSGAPRAVRLTPDLLFSRNPDVNIAALYGTPPRQAPSISTGLLLDDSTYFQTTEWDVQAWRTPGGGTLYRTTESTRVGTLVR